MWGFASTSTKSPAKDEQTSGLLADWTSYNAPDKEPDLEANNRSGNTNSQGASSSIDPNATMQQAMTAISGFFSSTASSVSSGVAALPSALPTSESFNIPSGQQMTMMFSFLAASAVFLFLAFFLFLPTIILSPSKFALSFTLGSVCLMAAFSALRGWKQQLAHMTTPERLPFSLGYIGSILATLYAALFMHSYILSLFCSGLQVVALLYYSASYFPGGTAGVKFILNMVWSAVSSCFGSLMKGR